MSKYNYVEIGNRIRNEREKLSMSQDDLLSHIKENGKPCFGRNTLSKLENGDASSFNAIKISHLISICEVFDCSISSLLGEYNFRNYDNKFICEQTQLSETAIENLKHFSTFEIGKNRLDIIDYLLNDEKFTYFLIDKILQYNEKYKNYKNGLVEYQKNCNTDPIELLQKCDSDEIKTKMTRKKLNEYQNSMDATQFTIQNDIREITDSLVEYFYNKK